MYSWKSRISEVQISPLRNTLYSLMLFLNTFDIHKARYPELWQNEIKGCNCCHHQTNITNMNGTIPGSSLFILHGHFPPCPTGSLPKLNGTA